MAEFFPVTITQGFRAWRRITVFVEAPDQDEARRRVVQDEYDIPAFEHPDWSTEWELQNEEVESGGQS